MSQISHAEFGLAQRRPARRIVVFAADENYAPFARGLVLSLSDAGFPRHDTDVGMVDTGCAPATLDWMRGRGVVIATFDAAASYGFAARLALPRYATAQICRPHLPALFPGHETYAWLDSDIWVQDAIGVEAFFDAVARDGRVAAVPWLDASYHLLLRKSAKITDMLRQIYVTTYGEAVADEFRGKPMLSSGAFAARGDSSFWRDWQTEIERLFNAAADSGGRFSHIAEQTAFNYVLLRGNLLVALDAAHNYHCHSGAARRSADGRVVIDVPPYRAVHVIHLSEAPGTMNAYFRAGLLYRRGEYLSDAERDALMALRRV